MGSSSLDAACSRTALRSRSSFCDATPEMKAATSRTPRDVGLQLGLDGLGKLLRRRETVVGVGQERPPHDLVERRRELRVKLQERGVLPLEDARRRLEIVGAGKEPPQRDGLPERHAHAEDVHAPVEGLTPQLLGGHEIQLAFDHPHLGVGVAALGLGDAEVHDARAAVDADDNILRRHIAVDDLQVLSFGAVQLMGGVQAREGVEADAQGDAERDTPTQRHRHLLHVGEGVALDVVHDEEDEVVLLAYVDDGDDIGVVDGRGDAGLVEKHVDKLVVLGEVRVHHLDGDQSPYPCPTRRAREIHRGHAAGANLGDDVITPDPRANQAHTGQALASSAHA
jgi:hypothetical protein